MQRERILLLCLILSSAASSALAQHPYSGHHHGHLHSWPGSGLWFGSGLRGWHGQVCNPPIIAVTGLQPTYPFQVPDPVFVHPVPVWIPMGTSINPVPRPDPLATIVPIVRPAPGNDPAGQPVRPTSAAGRLRSLEHQVRGDEKLRKHLWAQAYMSYRSAIDAAGDRGEARFRQGFTYTAMQHFASAVREFKRGLFLAPDLPATGIRLETLFGPDSQIVRTSILHKVADWVREEPRDSDRWFLLGLMLHFEGDVRCGHALQAARRLAPGNPEHIVALLDSPPEPAAVKDGNPPLLPELPAFPEDAVAEVPVLQLPDLNPNWQLDLPPLSDRAVPPIVNN